MLEAIEKLITLQERDRRIKSVREEMAHCPIERHQIKAKHDQTQDRLQQCRLAVQKLESERKELELEVESKQQLIDRYSVQQFQTKKNEEYKALTKEIDTCKKVIARLEDHQLDLMEQAEEAEKRVQEAKVQEAEIKRTTESRMTDLDGREKTLQTELAELESNRNLLASAVEDGLRNRYERLFKSKGNNVVVGIQHGVCGGCHMQLSRQIVVSCQAEQEIVHCINCGRILYYTPDMDLATAD